MSELLVIAALAAAALGGWFVGRHTERRRTGAHSGAGVDAQERYRVLVDHAPICIHELDLEGRLISMNAAGLRMMGASTEAEIRGLQYLDVVHEDDRERVAALLERARAGEPSAFVFRTKGEDPLTFSSSFIPIRSAGGEVVKMMGVTENITEQARTEAALRSKSTLLETTLETMDQGISLIDADLRLLAYNRNFVDFVLLKPEEVSPGAQIDSLVRLSAERGLYGEGDPAQQTAERLRRIGSGETHRVHVTLPDGRVLDVRGNPIPGGGMVTTFTDVTETHRLSRELRHQATHDALTGLTNRWDFEARLRRLLQSEHTPGSDHALCYLDLDHFKVVNDTCGHAAGDELLRQVSAELATLVRKRDSFARLGGDEFGVLMEHCTVGQAQRLAEQLRDTVERFDFVWEGKRFRIGVSIGLVPIVPGDTIADVLSAADNACYLAKETGGSRVRTYLPDDTAIAARHGEMQWVTRINRALEENRLRLAGQLIVPVAGAAAPPGEQRGHCEVLVRMVAEDGKLLAPGLFLPAAERYRLAPRVDRWVIARALATLAAYPAYLETLDLCAINLSGQSLSDDTLAAYIIEHLGPVRPQQLCLEITETAVVNNLTAARRFIETLRGHGVRFALDDFGTGAASFGYLKTLPVDFLKIDGSFVRDIDRDPVDLAMVRSINEIGQVTGKRTVAEFVEHQGILDRLVELGVDFAQGYHLHRPEPLEALLARTGAAPARVAAD